LVDGLAIGLKRRRIPGHHSRLDLVIVHRLRMHVLIVHWLDVVAVDWPEHSGGNRNLGGPVPIVPIGIA